MVHEFHLPYDASAAAIARDIVKRHISALTPELVDPAVLLVSELVTNAVVHGAPEVMLRVDVLTRAVQIEVVDRAATFTVDPAPPPTAATRGRGLAIVAALADRWGMRQQDGGGKAVWYRLAA